ncbi:MAG: hypothetical protein ACP5JG_02820 [Anaerolineae bacterium]
MPIRKLIREQAFHLARRDVAEFLEDHETDLLRIFREEMQKLDDEIPEESFFLDIKMVPLGETILKAALHAITRFLTEDFEQEPVREIPIKSDLEGNSLTLKHGDG